jgi:hypothetical protein
MSFPRWKERKIIVKERVREGETNGDRWWAKVMTMGWAEVRRRRLQGWDAKTWRRERK